MYKSGSTVTVPDDGPVGTEICGSFFLNIKTLLMCIVLD